MNETTEEAVDVMERLRQVSGGDDDAACKIARLFLDLTEDRLVKLKKAIDGDDLTAAEQQLHTIRGSSGNIGASLLSELSARCEIAIRDGAADEVEMLLKELEVTFDGFRTHLKRVLNLD